MHQPCSTTTQGSEEHDHDVDANVTAGEGRPPHAEPPPTRHGEAAPGRWWARAVQGWIALVVGFDLAVVFGLAQAGRPTSALLTTLFIVVPSVGALIVLDQPRHPTGWSLVIAGTAGLIGAAVNSVVEVRYAPGAPAWSDQVADVLWPLTFPLVCTGLLWFPDGRLPSRRWWTVAAASLAAILTLVLSQLVPWPAATNGASPASTAISMAESVLSRVPLAVTLLAFAAIVSIPVRYRRADADSRERIRWVLWAVLLQLVAGGVVIVLEIAGSVPQWVDGLSATPIVLGVPICVGIAILRYRVFDIDMLMSRTLLYTVLTVALVALYVGVDLTLGLLLGSSSSIPPLVAAVSVGAVFHPMRIRARRLIDPWLFGERQDPLAVLAKVSASVADSASPYPDLVTTVASSLHLSYVTLELTDPENPAGPPLRVATFGSISGTPLVEVPVRGNTGNLGALQVATRSRRQPLGTDELALLAALADQVAARIETERLAQSLQESRGRIVQAAEEERRRIRRDLHDGMGARLTAIGYTIEAATRTAASSRPGAPSDVVAALGRTKNDLGETVAELRRIIDDMRPGALDDLGLADALVGASRQILDGAGIDFTPSIGVDVGTGAPLGAATEAALYRIGLEAVTNVAHHSHASRSTLSLRRADGQIVLRVDDDGLGCAAHASPAGPYRRAGGVGVPSMHERAAELGGTVSISARARGGTTVTARLPLATAASDHA